VYLSVALGKVQQQQASCYGKAKAGQYLFGDLVSPFGTLMLFTFLLLSDAAST
jgi:hypothetical protein